MLRIPLASIGKLSFVGKLPIEAKVIPYIGWTQGFAGSIFITLYSFVPIDIYSVVFSSFSWFLLFGINISYKI